MKDILLKNHVVSCNFMLKYYITVSLRQFTKNKSFLSFISGKWKFGNLHPWLTWATEWIKTVFRYFYWIIFYNKWKLSQKYIIFIWLSPQQNNYSKNFILNSYKLLIFPALDIKKPALVDKILWKKKKKSCTLSVRQTWKIK